MIRVTIWNEHIQEAGDYKFLGVPEDKTEVIAWLTEGAKEIAKVHPNGMNETLAAHLRQFEDLEIRTVTLDMPDCGRGVRQHRRVDLVGAYCPSYGAGRTG